MERLFFNTNKPIKSEQLPDLDHVQGLINQGLFLFAGSYLFALAPYEKENFENIQKILFFFIRFWW